MGSAAPPWEKYSQPTEEAGPWQKYGAETAAPAPVAQGEPDRGEIPLTSHLAATEQGFNRVGQGAQHAVEGMANMVMHPIDTAKSILKAPGQLYDQAKQVPGAIRDINASEDPPGSYLQAAGRTAGEGGGQAITALAAEKLPGVVKDVAEGVGPKTKAIAKVAGQDAVSRIPVAGRLVRRPSIGDYIDAARTKAPEAAAEPSGLTPIQEAWKKRGGTLVGERPIVRAPRPKPSVPPEGSEMQIAPEPAPPRVQRALPHGQYEAPASAIPTQKQLGPGVIEGEYMDEPLPQVKGHLQRGPIQQRGGFEPNQPALPARGSAIPLPAEFKTARGPAIRTTPSEPLQPLRTVETPSAAKPEPVTPKKVGDLLNEGLGGKPLTPNVPLRQQGKAIPTEDAVPSGHSAVESSAIKSYKYDPATREFEFVSPSGAHYIHGDVSPEQMAEFEQASSKGKAFNEIKKNSTYVGKIVNGKRVAVKPSKSLASAAP